MSNIDIQQIADEWVAPFYLNFYSNPMDPALTLELKSRLPALTPEIVDVLFGIEDWRMHLTAAWFCGLCGWDQYTDRIGGLLKSSRLKFASAGYCFALARFAGRKSARYLAEYLTGPDMFAEHRLGLAALLWVDARRGTHEAGRFRTLSVGENIEALYERFKHIQDYYQREFPIAV